MIPTLKSAVTFILQLLLLTFVHMMGFIIAAQLTDAVNQSETTAQSRPAVARQQMESGTDHVGSTAKSGASMGTMPSKQRRLLVMVAVVCLSNSVVLMTWTLRSTLYGIGMSAGVFVVFLMCMTVMPQSETFFFLPESTGIIRIALVMGLVVCGLFSLAAVPILSRWKSPESLVDSRPRPGIRSDGVAWRLAVCALVYVALYLVFGYFVAWQNPELRSLYGGGQLSGFFEHIGSRTVATRVIPFQLARGIVWTLLCLFMMHVLVGSRVSQAIVSALMLSIVMNSQLLIPNPLMSQSVRMSHLFETATSNFLFGLFCVTLWSTR